MMRLILRTDVDGLGYKGDVVEVAPGYGRNYLVPRGLAIHSTPGAEAQAQDMRRASQQRDAAARQAAEEIATTLVNNPVTITARTADEDKLFGSVTATEIATAVEEQKGIKLDRKQVILDEPIKAVGQHLIPVKLHPDVQFPVTVEVVAEGID